MKDTFSTIVSGTADPAFAVDACGRILSWNQGARGFLGYPSGEVVGQRCFEILVGRDVFGNRFCRRTCPVREMAGRNEPVHHFEMSLRTASGSMADTGVTVLLIANGVSPDVGVVHLLQPAKAPTAMRPEAALSDGLAKLTPRELEVLRLIADGRNSAQVAAALFIGVATVRHHSQSILRKLDVHSRLEAAAVYHQAVSE